MRISEDRVSHLAHLMKDTIVTQNLGTITDVNKFLNKTKEVLTAYAKLDEEVEAFVRQKLASYSKSIMEGSREWDVMYLKHYTEEMKKRW